MFGIVIFISLISAAVALYLYKRYLDKRGEKEVYFEVMERGTRKEKSKISFIYVVVSILWAVLTFSLAIFLNYLRRITLPINELFYHDISLAYVGGILQLFSILALMSFPYYLMEFELFKKRLTKKQKRRKYKGCVYVSLIIIVLTLPFTILMYGTYDVVTENKIIKNEFWSLQEKEYNFYNLNRIEIVGSRSTEDIIMKVTFFTMDGKSFFLWHHWPLPEQQQFKDKKQIETLLYLKEKGVSINFVHPPLEEIKLGNARNKDHAIKIFTLLEGYFN
ncbi:hypothetical protein HOC13_01600 [Candidatus Woesearchaeota archaeon]|jgi:hypothetical protein|nr:hypothetical protein [Candidatus Woesearchaeota archaeon]